MLELLLIVEYVTLIYVYFNDHKKMFYVQTFCMFELKEMIFFSGISKSLFAGFHLDG